MEGFEFDFVHLVGDSFTVSGNAAYTDVMAAPTVNPFLCQLPGRAVQCGLAPAGTPNVVDLRELPLGCLSGNIQLPLITILKSMTD